MCVARSDRRTPLTEAARTEPHGGAEDSSQLDGGGLDTAGHPCLVFRNIADDGVRRRRHHQPDTETQQDERWPQVDVGGINLQCDKGEDGDRRSEQSRT